MYAEPMPWQLTKKGKEEREKKKKGGGFKLVRLRAYLIKT